MAIDFPMSHNVKIHLKIGDIAIPTDGPADTGRLHQKFEWKSFVNGGYIVRAKLSDSYWGLLKKVATQFYLNKGRKEPTKVEFEIEHPGVQGDNAKTGKYIAYMTDLDARGLNASGFLEFVAVDPPSYWLNSGASSGKVYTGKVSKVIEQTLTEWYVTPNSAYCPSKMKVSGTLDYEQNKWWMMRQDPKTFIRSLLDWSASVTNGQSNWMVSSDGFLDEGATILIEEYGVKKPTYVGEFSFNKRTPSANDVLNFEFLADNFISNFQRQLITQGLSAVSERYLDRKQDQPRKVVHIDDDRTPYKYKAEKDPKKSFAKPGQPPSAVEKPHEWSTSMWMVPEHNAGDVGRTYDKYIDGRARGMFLDMLPLVMRIKLRCTGIAKRELNKSHNLGTSWLRLMWFDTDNQEYWLSGKWIIYGFHHIITVGHWYTDIYCQRIDFDANARLIG